MTIAIMDKKSFLATLRETRVQWESMLADISQEDMELQDVEGHWSVKDIIAHITWGEREMVGVLKAGALVGSNLWELPQEDRNQAVYDENKSRNLADILEESRVVYEELLELLEKLPAAGLTEARRYQGMPEDWHPWKVFASNTYEHYRAHMEGIQAWMALR